MTARRRSFLRGKRASGLALALVFAAQAAPAQAAVASAAPSPMCQATGAVTSGSGAADARRVQRIVVSPASNTAFFGGKFTALVPAAGGAQVARNRLGACRLSTG